MPLNITLFCLYYQDDLVIICHREQSQWLESNVRLSNPIPGAHNPQIQRSLGLYQCVGQDLKDLTAQSLLGPQEIQGRMDLIHSSSLRFSEGYSLNQLLIH